MSRSGAKKRKLPPVFLRLSDVQVGVVERLLEDAMYDTDDKLSNTLQPEDEAAARELSEHLEEIIQSLEKAKRKR